MTLRAAEYAAPGHLGIALQAISDIMTEIGNATPILVGEYYASDETRGPGHPPHVILVPEPNGGRCQIGAPYETGRAAGQRHVCDVIVRAAESGTDLSHYSAAYELSDLMVAIVRRVCVGKVEFAAPVGAYPAPSKVPFLGAQVSWSFTYDRDIAHNDLVSRVAPAAPDNTTARPHGLPGTRGTLHTMTISTEAES